jgi:hypothetical protein
MLVHVVRCRGNRILWQILLLNIPLYIVERLLRFCMVVLLIRLGMDYLHSVYWLYLRELLQLLLAGRLKIDDAAWPGTVPG